MRINLVCKAVCDPWNERASSPGMMVIFSNQAAIETAVRDGWLPSEVGAALMTATLPGRGSPIALNWPGLEAFQAEARSSDPVSVFAYRRYYPRESHAGH